PGVADGSALLLASVSQSGSQGCQTLPQFCRFYQFRALPKGQNPAEDTVCIGKAPGEPELAIWLDGKTVGAVFLQQPPPAGGVKKSSDRVLGWEDALRRQDRLVVDLTANSVSALQIDTITGYLDDWESMSFDDKRKVVDILISQMDATSESVTIHWKI